MVDIPEEWLDKAISDGHINYLEYNKFTDPVVIGIGGFGTVFKYEWRDSELTVALKCFRVDKSIDEKIIKDFVNELKLLRKVCYHPNVITFYGVTKDNNGYYNMVLQYAKEGTLRDYLKANFTRLQWADKLSIANEIALGLLFLHDNNIIHRDLHSKNILIHQGRPKIADFGLSKQMNEMSMTSNSIVCGIPAYIEPKCFIDPKYKRDKKSDVYSFGLILWEISSGRPPFETFQYRDSLVIHIFQGNREEPIEGTPFQYIELYKKCWDSNPANRPETKLIFNTLKQLIPNETLSRHVYIEKSTQNSEVSSSHQDNTNVLINPSLYLPDTINSNSSVQDINLLDNLRKEAHEYFKQNKYFKALELFEKILRNSQHSPEDQKNASTWDLTCSCRSESLNELINALCKNTTLTSLCLSCNLLGSEGGKALANALCKNTTLTYLNLYNNNLGSEGGKVLANVLCMNTTLTSLDLSVNNLGLEGGKALADALCKNTALTFLDVSFNRLGLEGGKALANALCKNTVLTFLNVSYNGLESEGGKALEDALCKNTTLKILNIYYNYIDFKLSSNNLNIKILQ